MGNVCTYTHDEKGTEAVPTEQEAMRSGIHV